MTKVGQQQGDEAKESKKSKAGLEEESARFAIHLMSIFSPTSAAFATYGRSMGHASAFDTKRIYGDPAT
ncbi:MAG: hypothetical protein HC902_05480 [Calothrix sp. SM1_5_4]|nr:hypothetical protein [Calothrix sp. SM1_5_4]